MNRVTAAAFTSYQSCPGGAADQLLQRRPRTGSNGDMALIRWKRLAPFFLIGPVSGPLLAGVVFNFREGRPVLGSLYAIALAEFVVLLPYVTAALGAKVL
jgi:hypothetical protein